MTSGWEQFFPENDEAAQSHVPDLTGNATPAQPTPPMAVSAAAPVDDEPWGVPNLLAASTAPTMVIPDGVYNRSATQPVAEHKRSTGLMTAAAVLGVLVLGTSAVVGVHYYTDHTNQLESQSATGSTNGGTSNGGTNNGLGNSNGLVPNGGGSTNGGTSNGGTGNGFGTDPNGGTGNGFGFGPGGGQDPNDFGGAGSSGTGTSGTGTAATSAQQVGIVDINTTLGFEGGAAAGTGMVLTPNGEVLTNNHVIKGATSVSVTVVATGKTYTAKVLGYSKSDDVALLQLEGASNLATVRTSSNVPGVGTTVTGVGNAGGVGGTPSAATGKVTALNQDVTATDAGGGDPETVSGMIQTDAAIQSGDSGGPLMTSDNVVVGMDTAAGSNGGPQGFAIPIGHALSIASQIEAGQASSTVHIGTTAFLGVSMQDNNGAQVVNVVSGTGAANAGIAVGSIINTFNGKTITKSSDLIAAVSTTRAGQSVSVSWTDTTGQHHSATITLTAGPAQ